MRVAEFTSLHPTQCRPALPRHRRTFCPRFTAVGRGWMRLGSHAVESSHNGTCTRDPNMNLIIQYGLLGLVLGLGLGFILYCRIWRPLALPYMCPQPKVRTKALPLRHSQWPNSHDLRPNSYEFGHWPLGSLPREW